MVVIFRLILDAGHSRDMPIMVGNLLKESMREGMVQRSILGVSYRWKTCNVSLFLQHPFQQHPAIQRGKVLNENLHKEYIYRSRDLGNMITLRFSWKCQRVKAIKK